MKDPTVSPDFKDEYSARESFVQGLESGLLRAGIWTHTVGDDRAALNHINNSDAKYSGELAYYAGRYFPAFIVVGLCANLQDKLADIAQKAYWNLKSRNFPKEKL